MNEKRIEDVLIALKEIKEFTPQDISLEELEIGQLDQEFVEEKPERDFLNKENVKLYPLPQDTDFAVKYFIDGIQRTFFIGDIFCDEKKLLLPLVYFMVAAIILKREGRKLKEYDFRMLDKFVIPPAKYLPRNLRDALQGVTCIEVSERDIEFYGKELRIKMNNNYVSKERARIEQDIVQEFNKKVDDWLVIDGTLNSNKFFTNQTFLDSPKKIGVIKRHFEKYLGDSNYDVLKLFATTTKQRNISNKELRSPKFVFERKINGEHVKLLSAYAQLFPSKNPQFGLIRVETLDKFNEIFDDMFVCLFQERLPVPYDTKLWHKKIYPIRECEKFLSLKLPSVKSLKDLFTYY